MLLSVSAKLATRSCMNTVIQGSELTSLHADILATSQSCGTTHYCLSAITSAM
jgi:hypothetical protein